MEQTDPGQSVEEIGLSDADVLPRPRTGAKDAAGCHAVIVRAATERLRPRPVAARLQKDLRAWAERLLLPSRIVPFRRSRQLVSALVRTRFRVPASRSGAMGL
ncbi:hypothetical protein [Streptomyces sp. MMG1121]|uniref:hypothetical protein n=1 Tax=Streptomyces sp. MMG1121 TaxID=1415544 RepID=UPI00131BE873|nr:hypothetical protein [Streptomyces sp. MMG1121]